ncbi:MAG TPA: Mut7-C RNAse domain-containing protein [Thermoplasmata archaeon]|nr:Mut7-C RNAse domain-containing protein [Thermoplasmata archaeon]
MAPPRWLADEMLGRLARYLRFVGADTLYLRGLGDDDLLARAVAEDRVLLTRDRALAHRAPRSLWIDSSEVGAQWRAVRAAWPELPDRVRFERCSLCNGSLAPYRLGTSPEREEGVPRDRAANGMALWSCTGCGHLYWEGSHTRRIQEQLERWTAEPVG